jgi:hypothetical protein
MFLSISASDNILADGTKKKGGGEFFTAREVDLTPYN